MNLTIQLIGLVSAIIGLVSAIVSARIALRNKSVSNSLDAPLVNTEPSGLGREPDGTPSTQFRPRIPENSSAPTDEMVARVAGLLVATIMIGISYFTVLLGDGWFGGINEWPPIGKWVACYGPLYGGIALFIVFMPGNSELAIGFQILLVTGSWLFLVSTTGFVPSGLSQATSHEYLIFFFPILAVVGSALGIAGDLFCRFVMSVFED